MNTTAEKRFDEIAWALILIMTGALWLAPRAMFPDGTWLAGAGLVLLGLQAARRLSGVRTSGLGILIGLLALAAGAGRIVGLEVPVIPVLLVILGLGLVIGGAARKDKTAGGSTAS